MLRQTIQTNPIPLPGMMRCRSIAGGRRSTGAMKMEAAEITGSNAGKNKNMEGAESCASHAAYVMKLRIDKIRK